MRLCTKEWAAIDDICQRELISRNHLFELIENNKSGTFGLTYSIRLFSLLYFQKAAKSSKTAHEKADLTNIERIIDEISLL